MRILWVKTELLHPVDKGGKIRTYQMLRSLSRKHTVSYLCLDDGDRAPDAEAKAMEYCSEVEAVPFSPPGKGTVAFFGALLLNLFSRLPYAVARYRSKALARRVAVRSATSDLVICDFLAPALNVATGGCPAVLFQHNVEAIIWERHASVPQNSLRRFYMSLQASRMKRFEASECRRFDHVVAVSEADATEMATRYGATRVSFVGTGVDTEFFMRSAPIDLQARSMQAHEMVFVGSMDWMPNEEGIRWFVAEVFGRVRSNVPDAMLTIVGRSPSRQLEELAERTKGVRVVGTVPDVRPYLERAAMSIVPLRIGGGTRIKIYESMSMGTPVVSTTIGAEGLPVIPGVHLEIADTPEAMASAITDLFTDHRRASTLAVNAERFVRANCGWDAVTDDFISQCLPGRRDRFLEAIP